MEEFITLFRNELILAYTQHQGAITFDDLANILMKVQKSLTDQDDDPTNIYPEETQ